MNRFNRCSIYTIFAKNIHDMEKKSNYKEPQPDFQVASESALGYHTHENEVAYLPEDILVAAVKCADIARRRGEMIPHDQVYSMLSKRLGWK